jgi:hypothetical protein
MPGITYHVSSGQLRASIRYVLTSLQQMISTGTGLDPNAVFIVRRRDHFVNVAEQSVAIWVRGETPDGPAVEGGGRVNDMRTRLASILVRSRTMMDENDRDTNRLTDYSLGHLQLEDQVYNAVQVLQETDQQSNWIISYPQRFAAFSEPTADPKNTAFSISTMDIKINYVRDLTQTLQ